MCQDCGCVWAGYTHQRCVLVERPQAFRVTQKWQIFSCFSSPHCRQTLPWISSSNSLLWWANVCLAPKGQWTWIRFKWMFAQMRLLSLSYLSGLLVVFSPSKSKKETNVQKAHYCSNETGAQGNHKVSAFILTQAESTAGVWRKCQHCLQCEGLTVHISYILNESNEKSVQTPNVFVFLSFAKVFIWCDRSREWLLEVL